MGVTPEIVGDERNPSEAEIFDRVQRLSVLLDSSIPLGKSGIRIGLDPIIGLIPGIGDAIGSLLSGYIIFQAAQLGVSRWVLIRMIGNVAIEALVGVIPIFGDIFDFVFKANQRNIAILRNAPRVASLADAQKRLISTMLIVGACLLVFMIGAMYLAFLMLEALIARVA
jgi:hypothetical protein